MTQIQKELSEMSIIQRCLLFITVLYYYGYLIAHKVKGKFK